LKFRTKHINTAHAAVFTAALLYNIEKYRQQQDLLFQAVKAKRQPDEKNIHFHEKTCYNGK